MVIWRSRFRTYVDYIGSGKTTPDKFVNAALFLQLGLPSTLIHHETELSGENALQSRWIWKRRPPFSLSFGRIAFWKRNFTKTMELSSNTNLKWPVSTAFLNWFSDLVWTENRWCFELCQKPIQVSQKWTILLEMYWDSCAIPIMSPHLLYLI